MSFLNILFFHEQPLNTAQFVPIHINPKSKTPMSYLKTSLANILIATVYYCTHIFSITQEEFNDQQFHNFVKKKKS